MTFFFDNNMSPRLVNGLVEFGEDAIHLKTVFREDAPDVEWLKYLGSENVCLITRDNRILRNPAEKAQLVNHNVGAFFVRGKQLNHCDLIRIIIKHWPKIKEFAGRTPRPFAAKITKSSGIEPIALE